MVEPEPHARDVVKLLASAALSLLTETRSPSPSLHRPLDVLTLPNEALTEDMTESCLGCGKISDGDSITFTMSMEPDTDEWIWWRQHFVTTPDTKNVTFPVCSKCWRFFQSLSAMEGLNSKIAQTLARTCSLQCCVDSTLPRELVILVLEYTFYLEYTHFTKEPLPLRIEEPPGCGYRDMRLRCCSGGAMFGDHKEEQFEISAFLKAHKDGRYFYYRTKYLERETMTVHLLHHRRFLTRTFSCAECKCAFVIPLCPFRWHRDRESTLLPVSYGRVDLVDKYWCGPSMLGLQEYVHGHKMIYECGSLSGEYWVSEAGQKRVGAPGDYICGGCLETLLSQKLIKCQWLH